MEDAVLDGVDLLKQVLADAEANNGYFLNVESYGTGTIVLKKVDNTPSPIILGGPFSFVRLYETE